VIGIVQRWVQKDPKGAATWVEQFPDSDLKQTALENVVKLWADKDSEQVTNWINGLPDGWMQDTAVTAFANWLTPASPASAASWSDSIKKENAR